MTFYISLFILSITKYVFTTIDMNLAELEYLADHLTPEECRRLVAAAHFKTYEEPNSLDQAERKISKDIKCIELLHHWNSAPNEGKGETHEVLVHRLKQMGKQELADWLGKTVFHELGIDLNRSLEQSFKDSVILSTTNFNQMGPTLIPIIQNSDPSEYSYADNILYALVVGLMLTAVVFIVRCGYGEFCSWRRKKREMKNKLSEYEAIEFGTSDSESEDRFDLRDFTRKYSSV